jgi:hypothetical protein
VYKFEQKLVSVARIADCSAKESKINSVIGGKVPIVYGTTFIEKVVL